MKKDEGILRNFLVDGLVCRLSRHYEGLGGVGRVVWVGIHRVVALVDHFLIRDHLVPEHFVERFTAFHEMLLGQIRIIRGGFLKERNLLLAQGTKELRRVAGPNLARGNPVCFRQNILKNFG